MPALKKKKNTKTTGLVFVIIEIFDLLPILKSLAEILVDAICGRIGLPIETHLAIKINSGGSVETKFPNVVNFELLNGVEIIVSSCENDSS